MKHCKTHTLQPGCTYLQFALQPGCNKRNSKTNHQVEMEPRGRGQSKKNALKRRMKNKALQQHSKKEKIGATNLSQVAHYEQKHGPINTDADAEINFDDFDTTHEVLPSEPEEEIFGLRT